ncbi:beta strand repeat-containing protein [Brevundimonas sp.]|uniref:beta strand repeat-containing protein n=1 Tax=Brevundimonas sp. TaxID=1871086 RepID=UPI002ED78FE6
MPTTWTTTTDPIGDTGSFDSRMIFGDFDGDGDIDILYQNGNTAGSGIGYLRNDGGTFTNFTDATAAGSIFAGVDFSGRQISPASFFIFDFDSDGDLDILDRTSGSTTFFRNNANGGFTRITDPVPDTGAFDQRMVWGDFDNDGDVDALYQNGNTAGSGIGFLRNDGALTFTNFTDASAAGTPFTGVSFAGLQVTTSTFVVDVDDDGDMDILDRGATQVMYRNDAGTMVRTTDPLADIGAFDARMIFGDFDSDGDTDAIYQNGNTAGTGFGYFRNDGGTFTNFTTLTGTPFAGLDLAGQQLTTWTAVDIDDDGDVDIVDRDQAAGGLVLYRQNGAPPTLVSSTPSDNGTGVASSANITLTFSESVSKGNGNIYIYRGDGTLIETISVNSVQVSGSGTTWTIDPSVTLQGLTNYYILIDQETFADSEGAVFAGISNATTLNFTTAAVNTAPTFGNLNGDAAAHTENVAVRLDVGGNATVADAESANFDTGTLTVSITGNGQSGQDVLSIANIGNGAGQIGVSGAAVFYAGVQIGTFTGGSGGANLVITFDADATPAAVQALVRALQYNNTSDAPNTATRTVTVVLTDGDGGTSTTQTTTVSVTAANDPHTGGVSVSGTATENQTLTAVSTLADPDGLGTLHYDWQRDTGSGFVSIGAADQPTYTLGDADVGAVVRVVVTYTDAGGTSESSTSAGTSAVAAINDPHTGGASITGTTTEDQVLTAVSTLADVDGLGTLHYDWQRDTGSGFVSIGAADQATYTLGDADVGAVVRVVISYTDGQGFSESATSAGTATIANVDDAAVAVDDVNNTGESSAVSGTVFGNDSDIDGPALTVAAVNGSAASVGTQITLPSGALLTLNADGTYSYDPNGVFQYVPGPSSGSPNQTATDSFTYTLANGNTATVTITINGEDSEGDVVTGGGGDDVLVSGDGDDTLQGSAGNDTLTGGAGNDTADYSGASSGVQVRLDRGDTPTDGDGGTDTLTDIENVTGSAFNDVLGGNNGANVLSGGGGFDVLVGRDGNDVLHGGSGAANQLIGGTGDDTYYVDANDTIVELLNEGYDTINTTRSTFTLPANVEALTFVGAGAFTGIGNGLDNTLTGGAGDDFLRGGAGNDTLRGAGGSDTADYLTATGAVTANLTGGTASDGQGGTDSFQSIENLRGGAFNDTLYGDANANILDGSDGNDTLVGRGGNDTLRGGAGTDTADYSDSTSGIVARLNTGVITDGEGGTDFVTSIENVVGGAHNDVIIASTGDNVLWGGGGMDILIGGVGNDTLHGGAGTANELYGGIGDDTYVVTAYDTLVELSGEGTDLVQTTLNNYFLAANIENMTFTGTGNFAGAGNDLANVLTGGDGADTLTGGGGNDTLNGGLGRDTVVVSGASFEYTIEYLGGTQYRITDNVGGRDGIDILNGMEEVRFSNGITAVLNGGVSGALFVDKEAGAPLVRPATTGDLFMDDDSLVLTLPPLDGLKDVDAPLVLPGLTDDDFLIKTFEGGPQVLPRIEDILAGPAGIRGHDAGLGLLPVDRTVHLDDLGLAGGLHGHDDWLL